MNSSGPYHHTPVVVKMSTPRRHSPIERQCELVFDLEARGRPCRSSTEARHRISAAAGRVTRVAALARFFEGRPNVWIDGRELALVAGAYAWRTRLSDLRRPPFRWTIENRQRRLTAAGGRCSVVSEYRWVCAAGHLDRRTVEAMGCAS